MPRVTVFEDLVAWQKARALGRLVSRVTGGERFKRDLRQRDQMRGAAASTMSNIAEGFDRGRRTEFRQFLSIAKGSAAEVRSLLYFCLDAELLTSEEFEELLAMSREVAKLIAGLRRSVGQQAGKGR